MIKVPTPALVMCSQWGRERQRYRHDLRNLLAQVGAPPDLRFLRGALACTRAIVAAHADELSQCLRAVPGSRHESAELVETLDRVLAWIALQPWAESDARLQAIGRVSALNSNPLRGYCLVLLYHWANLFYDAEPDPTDPAADRGFGAVRDEFSIYVLAAQSTLNADEYLPYLKRWWSAGRQPELSPFDDSHLASRVAAASRALRRLSLLEHCDLLRALTQDLSKPLHQRLYVAMQSERETEQRAMLNALARLLEFVKPGWRRPGGGGRDQSSSRSSPVGTRRTAIRDGYVRLAGGGAVVLLTELEEGYSLETFQLEQDQSSWDAEDESQEDDLDDGSPDDLDGPLEKPKARSRRKRRKLEEEVAGDGSEWMPQDDLVGPVRVDCLIAADEHGQADDGDGIRQVGESRWASEHARRSHQAHALPRGRLPFADAWAVLKAMRNEAPNCPIAKDLLRLHVALALGRSWSKLSTVTISPGLAPPTAMDDSEIVYRLDKRRWILPAAPPAWKDLEVEVQERRIWTTLEITDHTGFYDLLAHFGMLKPWRSSKPEKGRHHAITQWLKSVLPDNPPTAASCSRFLVHRLLEESGGDLGVVRLITGTLHSHGSSVAHYAHLHDRDLWRHYRTAWRSQRRGTWDGVASSSSFSDQGDGYGARRVPTRSAVNLLFDELWRRIQTRSGAEQRNLYTAYSVAAWILGIGMRPVTDPHFLEYADLRGRLLVSFIDKAKTDYHRRVNGMPPPLEIHARRYEHFRDALNREEPPPSIHRLIFRYQDPDTLKWSAFRPIHFKKLVESFFPFEPYALRRYARTQLVAQGVELEDVDAFMGHWWDGVSPFDPRSTYPIKRVLDLSTAKAQSVRACVATMMSEAGFRPRWMPRAI